MDLADKRKPGRKELVIAAEQTVEKMFASGKPAIKKTQLNHLISVCGEATCVEEITNYIRYQAGRKTTGWEGVATQVIDGIDKALAGIEEDRLRVEAFRLYAIFLTRAFTYRDAMATMANPSHGGQGGPAGPGQGRRR
jgi:hypothetical protein